MKTECWAHGKSKEAADPKAFGAPSVASQRKVFYFRGGVVGTPQPYRGQVARSCPVLSAARRDSALPFATKCAKKRRLFAFARICSGLLALRGKVFYGREREKAPSPPSSKLQRSTKHQAPRARIALYRLIPRYTAFCAGSFLRRSQKAEGKRQKWERRHDAGARRTTREGACAPQNHWKMAENRDLTGIGGER